MLENRQKSSKKSFQKKKLVKTKVAGNQILRVLNVSHITTLYKLCIWQGVRSYPPRITEHHFFNFGHFGSADPNFFHLFGHKKLGNFMVITPVVFSVISFSKSGWYRKFHGHYPSSFFSNIVFKIWLVQSDPPLILFTREIISEQKTTRFFQYRLT